MVRCSSSSGPPVPFFLPIGDVGSCFSDIQTSAKANDTKKIIETAIETAEHPLRIHPSANCISRFVRVV